MTLYEEILAEANLLLEIQNPVTVEKIRDAIENCKKVSIMYNDGKGGGGKSWRYIYPVVYGELKNRSGGGGNGHMAVRAFQTKGSTKRGQNAWKLFRVDRIVAWYNQENTETDKTHTFTKEQLGQLFNDKGDKYFHTITCHSPFVNVEYLIDSEPINKDDIKQDTGTDNGNVENATVKYTYNPDWKNQYNQENEKGISLDNNGNVSYNSEKLSAPETEPVTKDMVNQGASEPKTDSQVNKMMADNKPITKDEVNNGEDSSGNNNELTDAYTSLMNRWNNKDEEEKSYS